MQILQKPNSISFENNLKDIIIQKTGSETAVIFRLYQGANLVIEENYVFDTQGYVYIRDLSNLVAFYFSNSIMTYTGYTAYTGLIKTFTFTLNGASDVDFRVIRSAAVISGISATGFIRSGFLTRTAQSKRTDVNSNEFLSFVQLIQDGTWTVNYKIFYKSGANILETSGVLIQIPSGLDRIVTFNASLKTVLSAASLTPDQVFEYRIWASNSNLNITFNQYSFFPDYSIYRHKNVFVFENCFGVPEVFISTGETVSNRKLDAGFAFSGQRMRKSTQEFEISHDCNSGYLSIKEMDWLDDFITSYNISLMRKGTLQEVVLTETDKFQTDRNSLQSFNFKYRFSGHVHIQINKSVSGIFDYTFDNSFE